MIKNLFIILLLSTCLTSFGQDTKKEAESIKTKMDAFSSKTGVIIKFIETNLPNLATKYEAVETRIRRFVGGSGAYFYQIEKSGKYGSTTASIEYSDLVEVNKAITALRSQVEADVALNPDYIENKFTTVDGFQIGYYVSKGKAQWFIKLEKYGSDSTVFIDNPDIIETAFTGAKNKIDELKSK